MNIDQKTVDDNLDNALENEGWQWAVMSKPELVADDMTAYSVDFEENSSKELLPFIVDWQNRQIAKRAKNCAGWSEMTRT